MKCYDKTAIYDHFVFFDKTQDAPVCFRHEEHQTYRIPAIIGLPNGSPSRSRVPALDGDIILLNAASIKENMGTLRSLMIPAGGNPASDPHRPAYPQGEYLFYTGNNHEGGEVKRGR